MILIRKAIEADAATLGKFCADCFVQTYAWYNTPENMQEYVAANFTEAKLISEIAASDCTILLAVIDEEIAGYIKLNNAAIPCLNASNPLEIARLYAATHLIGQGIGKALMQACTAFAKQQNHDAIWLGVWEQNPKAIAFYTKAGFTKMGDAQFLLGTDLQHDFIYGRFLR